MTPQKILIYCISIDIIDILYYHTARGVAGTLVQRLESLGELLCLVVGAFGEVSEDLDRIIRAMAESRALYLSRETGMPVSDVRAGWILGQYRRLLSCLFIRSQASCLLARMGHLGEGAKECAARRRVSMAEEERRTVNTANTAIACTLSSVHP